MPRSKNKKEKKRRRKRKKKMKKKERIIRLGCSSFHDQPGGWMEWRRRLMEKRP